MVAFSPGGDGGGRLPEISGTIRTRRLRQASDCRKQLQIYALDDFSGRWGVLIDLAYPPPELFVVYAFPRYMIDEIEQ